jgi:hypothetical protein
VTNDVDMGRLFWLHEDARDAEARLRREDKILLPAFGVIIVAGLLTFPLYAFGWQYGWLSPVAVYAPFLLLVRRKVLLRRQDEAADAWAKERDAALAMLPMRFKVEARDLLGHDWELSAIECYTGHIAGDCQLCGAN